MLSMPFADPTSSTLPRHARRAAGALIALATFAVSGLALAETGGPLPQGYTGDVNAAPQAAPAAQQAAYPADEQQAQQPPQVQQVQQAQPQQAQAEDDGYADDDPSALSDFQAPLAGHGSWVQDPTYGTIWVPDSAEVGTDFAPYQTAGQWGTTDAGDWMWESDYSWGYIPFHYGRWVWAGGYWGWIPGRVYAPAWVSWRVGDGGYLGWAPLPPTWYWGPGGYAVGLRAAPWGAYCFVPTQYAFYHGVGGYVVHDHATVQAAGAGTRLYTAPGVNHGGVTPGPHGRAYPGSPSLAEAHVPASAAPHNHVSADPRATAYASRSSMAAMRGGAGARGDASHRTYDGFGRSRTPSLRTPSSGESYHAGGSYYREGGGSFHSSTPSYSGQHTGSNGGTRTRASSSYHPSYHPSGHFSGGHSSGGHSGGGHR